MCTLVCFTACACQSPTRVPAAVGVLWGLCGVGHTPLRGARCTACGAAAALWLGLCIMERLRGPHHRGPRCSRAVAAPALPDQVLGCYHRTSVCAACSADDKSEWLSCGAAMVWRDQYQLNMPSSSAVPPHRRQASNHECAFARYQRGSEVCQKLAESLAHLTGSEERELFDFGRRAGEAAPLMLILDRRDDPVTPLLQQWTFQVARHESLWRDAASAAMACMQAASTLPLV